MENQNRWVSTAALPATHSMSKNLLKNFFAAMMNIRIILPKFFKFLLSICPMDGSVLTFLPLMKRQYLTALRYELKILTPTPEVSGMSTTNVSLFEILCGLSVIANAHLSPEGTSAILNVFQPTLRGSVSSLPVQSLNITVQKTPKVCPGCGLSRALEECSNGHQLCPRCLLVGCHECLGKRRRVAKKK